MKKLAAACMITLIVAGCERISESELRDCMSQPAINIHIMLLGEDGAKKYCQCAWRDFKALEEEAKANKSSGVYGVVNFMEKAQAIGEYCTKKASGR